MTYPAGWAVIPRLIVRKERWPGGYQARGVPLVYRGQEVVPDQPVLRLESQPQNQQEKSDVAALRSSPAVYALPPQNQNIPAGLHGRVVDLTMRGGVVIESHAALVQGTLGAGNQVAGVLTMWSKSSDDSFQTIPPGAILVVPGPLTLALLHQALNSGVVGIVASSIALRDLEGFLQTDYLQLLRINESERAQSQLPPLTLLLTEGIGSATMPAHVLNLLNQYQGSIALLSGRRSLIRNLYPELIISVPLAEVEMDWQPVQPDTTLFQGAQVSVRGGEFNGTVGRIDYFFSYEQAFASGLRTRAVRLLLDDGSYFVVPAVMIERIR
jgi:hypothetical protein